MGAGNVAVARAPWNAAYLDELASFPDGMKDDQVDASSRAFAMVSASGGMRISAAALRVLGGAGEGLSPAGEALVTAGGL